MNGPPTEEKDSPLQKEGVGGDSELCERMEEQNLQGHWAEQQDQDEEWIEGMNRLF